MPLPTSRLFPRDEVITLELEVAPADLQARLDDLERRLGPAGSGLWKLAACRAQDPVFAPGTGTPEVGGLTTIEAQRLIRGLRGLDIVGGDVVEVSPPFDPSGNTALNAATVMFEILCVLADSLVARR